MPEPRVAVIGHGYWGRNIVRNFAALGALDMVCEANPGARDAAARAYPDIQTAESADPAFASPHIDAIAIATPAASHGELVELALEAGKHVFVEKPLCLDLEQAMRLKESAERKGLVLMVGHLLLYHPAFVALSKRVRNGDLGALRYIYSNRLSLGKIRREENALWSFAPHDISMILQLMGGVPDSVTANGGHYLSDGVADTTISHMSFGNGVQAHIFVSWLHPFKDQRLVVVGDRAMAVFNDVAAGPEKLLLYRHKAEWDGEVPVVNKADAEPIPYGDDEPLRCECATFLAAVRGEAHPPSDADEGIRVLSVLDACQRSIASGTSIRLKPHLTQTDADRG